MWGAWRGDGSWSLVNGGPSVVLEYGTVSPFLADGLHRLLLAEDIVATQRIGENRQVHRRHLLAACLCRPPGR